MAVKYLAGNRLWGTDAERLGMLSTWDSVTGINDCDLSDGDTTSTATSSSNWECRCNSTDISDRHHFTLGGSGSDNYRIALVTSAQRTSGTLGSTDPSDTSFMVLVEGLAGSTDANLFSYTDGGSASPVCTDCIDTTKEMSLIRSGSTWTFAVDGVSKATYSSSSDFYLQNLVQKASMAITLKPSSMYLPNGATFLTSDTNKLYMWDGTDTWNEVG